MNAAFFSLDVSFLFELFFGTFIADFFVYTQLGDNTTDTKDNSLESRHVRKASSFIDECT